MTHVAGAGLAIGLICLIIAGLVWSWRRPFVGLGLLVAGLAFHNFVLMALIGLGTPTFVVHAVQGWKEAILALLAVVALARLRELRRGNAIGPLIATDWIAGAFAVVCIVYFLIPPGLLGSAASFSQRLVGLRTLVVIPLLYFLGRSLMAADDRERLLVACLALGAAAVVTLFGIIEVFAVPTRVWLDWGVNQYSSFLGFTYGGPQGLPENFFITLGHDRYVRRMVSTYVSPLGIAYTGLVVFPLAIAAIDCYVSEKAARWLAAGTALLILGVAMSITRLAVIAMVGEALILALLLRRSWVLALPPVLVVATIVTLVPSAAIAPTVDSSLNPAGGSRHVQTTDTSTAEHQDYFIGDVLVDLQHPLGLGTGASTIRFGKQQVSTGESAVLGMFGDLGVAGGLLYLALFCLTIWQGFKALSLSRAGTLEGMLPMVALVGGLALIPISLTSDVWGDLSVTFPFWWSAGAAATLCAQRAARTKRAPEAVRARRWRISPS